MKKFSNVTTNETEIKVLNMKKFYGSCKFF